MVNKTKIVHTSHAVLLMMASGLAFGECVINETITSEVVGKIEHKTNMQIDVTADDQLAGKDTALTCHVTYDTVISGQTFKAKGSYTWDGKANVLESCKLAEKEADKDVLKKINTSLVTARSRMDCSDEINTAFNPKVGAVGKFAQFRMDSEHPGPFKYKGVDCYRFVDTDFNGKDLVNLNGVACTVEGDDLLVIDRW